MVLRGVWCWKHQMPALWPLALLSRDLAGWTVEFNRSYFRVPGLVSPFLHLVYIKEENIYSELRAQFSTQTSLGRFPRPSELDRSSGWSPWLWYSGVSQICSHSELLWFANQVFPINCDLLLHLHSVFLPDSGHLVCSATQSGKTTRNTRESAHSPSHTEGRGAMHLIF